MRVAFATSDRPRRGCPLRLDPPPAASTRWTRAAPGEEARVELRRRRRTATTASSSRGVAAVTGCAIVYAAAIGADRGGPAPRARRPGRGRARPGRAPCQPRAPRPAGRPAGRLAAALAAPRHGRAAAGRGAGRSGPVSRPPPPRPAPARRGAPPRRPTAPSAAAAATRRPAGGRCPRRRRGAQVKNHPCYSQEAHHHFARMHVAVAPACNIQCHYCNRKYDCANESRPGRGLGAAHPGRRRSRKVLAVAAEVPQLSVVGIAGPGDPLANPGATFAGAGGGGAAPLPDLTLCLSTNGLALPDHVERLAALGVRHVTVTVNMVDPAVGERIYPWVIWKGRKVRGLDAARILSERQLEGLARLRARGVLCKVNSVVIPGVNDGHLPEVSRRLRAAGGLPPQRHAAPLGAGARHPLRPDRPARARPTPSSRRCSGPASWTPGSCATAGSAAPTRWGCSARTAAPSSPLPRCRRSRPRTPADGAGRPPGRGGAGAGPRRGGAARGAPGRWRRWTAGLVGPGGGGHHGRRARQPALRPRPRVPGLRGRPRRRPAARHPRGRALLPGRRGGGGHPGGGAARAGRLPGGAGGQGGQMSAGAAGRGRHRAGVGVRPTSPSRRPCWAGSADFAARVARGEAARPAAGAEPAPQELPLAAAG